MSDVVIPKHLFFVKDVGDRARFCARMQDEVVPSLRDLGATTLKIGLTERPTPRATVLPLRPENLLMLSVWGPIDPARFLDRLRSRDRDVFGYVVDESYPVRYERTWPDGQASPGDVLLTLLAKNRALDHAAFMHEWHGRHTPKAMRIHPMWSYARNVVTGRLGDDAPSFEGVVEEHYRELRDILNPIRMFGGPLRFVPNMIEVGRHASHFLDLRATENYLLRERYIATAR